MDRTLPQRDRAVAAGSRTFDRPNPRSGYSRGHDARAVRSMVSTPRFPPAGRRARPGFASYLAACLLVACSSTAPYPPTAPSTGQRPPPVEAQFKLADLAKSDIDAVAEVHLRESIASAKLLMEKLYRRNPRELKKSDLPTAGSRGRPGLRSASRLALCRALEPARHRRDAARLSGRLHGRPSVCLRRRGRQHDRAGLRRQDAVLSHRQPRRAAPVQRRAQPRDRGVETRQRPRTERRAAAPQQRDDGGRTQSVVRAGDR